MQTFRMIINYKHYSIHWMFNSQLIIPLILVCINNIKFNNLHQIKLKSYCHFKTILRSIFLNKYKINHKINQEDFQHNNKE